jgi:hypothetical protein
LEHAVPALPQLVPAATWLARQLPAPLQVSGASHWPAEGSPQLLPARANPSAGHAADEPLQLSATSHGLAEGRHIVFALAKPSEGQVLLTPSQDSATSQSPAEGRHTAVLLASGGQAAELPVQVSATSQAPTDPRQVAPALPGVCEIAPVSGSQLSTVHGLPSSKSDGNGQSALQTQVPCGTVQDESLLEPPATHVLVGLPQSQPIRGLAPRT